MLADRLRRLLPRRARERSSTHYLPQWSHLDPPHVVRLMGGGVQAFFEVQGARWEDLDDDELAAQHEALCALYRTIGHRHRLTLHKVLVRTEAADEDYPRFALANPFVREMEAAYRARQMDEGRLMRNTLYLAVTIRPQAIGKISASPEAPAEPGTVDPAILTLLGNVLDTIEADLRATYGLRRLGLRLEGRIYYSEPAEALHLILTARRKKVPLPRGRLGRAICAHRPVIRGDRTIELRHLGGTDYASMSAISVYPEGTDSAMLDLLLAAQYRFVLSQSWTTMPLHEAQGVVTRTTNQFISADDPAYTQKKQLGTAKDELQQRRYGLGIHNLTLMVVADTEAALMAAEAEADKDLRASGAIISAVDWELEGAYFGQVPGAENLHPRSAPIKSRNFAAFGPMHNFPSGWRGGKWCDHVALFKTSGGTPYYWNPHVSESGGAGPVPHMLITGPNGSGKTTALLFLLAQIMDRAGAQVVLWDKDRGAKLAVLRLGGSYLEIPVGSDTGLAPLKALDGADAADMAYLIELFRGLILSDGLGKMTEEEGRRLVLALRTVMAMPPELRSFGEVAAFLGVGSSGAAARLRRWCAGDELGWVLDNPADRVNLNSRFIAFDQTRYLDHPTACAPIQSYLFQRIGKLADGRRLVVAIDEFWKSLLNEAFRGVIQNGLATFRKVNCAMWLATQSVKSALMAEDIAHTIREQCLTQMHFANGGAKPADFCDGPQALGLPDRAFAWIKTDLSRAGGGPGRFLLKQGNHYTPVQLDLDGMDDIIAILSGETPAVALMDEIIAERGGAEDIDGIFREWHARRKSPGFRALARHDRHPSALQEAA